MDNTKEIHTTSIAFPVSLWKKAKHFAVENEMTFSGVVKIALEEFLEFYEEEDSSVDEKKK